MKKNTMMRIASFLLIAVLLSTSAISGTYAKYVTSDNGSDSARVAKWGVTVTVKGSLFSNSYKDAPTTYTLNEAVDTITVQAYTESDNLVAPGTKNEDGMTFVLTGTPEVDTKIEIAIKAEKDVKLPAGTYDDWTTGDTTDTFTLDNDYYPVVFTLTNGSGVELAKGNLATIETYLEGLSKTYHTNTDLSKISTNTDGTYKLTWAWAFDGAQTLNGKSFTEKQVDQADTYLGNVAATLISDATAVTDISFEISITATQVD